LKVEFFTPKDLSTLKTKLNQLFTEKKAEQMSSTYLQSCYSVLINLRQKPKANSEMIILTSTGNKIRAPVFRPSNLIYLN